MPGSSPIPTSGPKTGVTHASQSSGTQAPKGFFARLRQLLSRDSTARASGTSTVSAASLPPLTQHGLAVGTPPTAHTAATPEAKAKPLDAKDAILKEHPSFDVRVERDHPEVSSLPSALRNSEEFKALGRELNTALTAGNGRLSADQIKDFGSRLHSLLNRDSVFGGIKLNLVLTDGTAFMDSLLNEARKGQIDQPAGAQQTPAAKTALAQIYNKAMVGLGDRVEDEGRVIVVKGETYTHSKRIGSGQFGQADVYVSTNPDSKMPKLVVKRPKMENEDLWAPPAANSGEQAAGASAGNPYGYAAKAKPQTAPNASHFKIDIPAREGLQLMNALGTGATDDITPLLGAIRTEDSLLLVFPFETHGSYEHQLPSLRRAIGEHPQKAKEYAQAALTPLLGLSRGIERLQVAKGQLHGDIAPRNVLITAQGKGRLADFGLTKQLQGMDPAKAEADKTEGTFPVRASAPELLKKARGEAATVTRKADTWMFGMTLFEVLHGSPYAWTLPEGVKAIDHIAGLQQSPTLPPIPAPWPESMREPLQKLMADCLQIDPEKRPSMDEIQRRLTSDLVGAGSPQAEELLQQVLTS